MKKTKNNFCFGIFVTKISILTSDQCLKMFNNESLAKLKEHFK